MRTLPVRHAYARVRSLHDRCEGGELFENGDEYARAMYRKGSDGTVLRTHDGLNVAIRRNLWDAEIVGEIFFQQPYTRYLNFSMLTHNIELNGYGDRVTAVRKAVGRTDGKIVSARRP